MSTHSRLSPSSRHRWALCPGSVREEAKYPEQGSGPAAIDGTHSHTLLEHCIKNSADPLTLAGIELCDHDGAFVVDTDRAERVKVAIDYIRDRSLGQDCQVISEQRVNPKLYLGRDDLSGTVDCQIIGPKWVEIIDYKDGMAPVDACENMQLEQYAYGVLSKFVGTGITHVTMTIIQPKLRLKGLNPISKWEITVDELVKRSHALLDQAAATDDPNAPLVPGESQCKYCRAKGSCAALAGNVMQEVGIMFQPVVTETLDVAQQSADKDPAAMDDAQIRQILEAAPLMRQLLEGVEKEALRRLEAGQSIPGFKLVHGRGSRAWALPEDQMAEKLVKMGIPKGAIYETKIVSPAKAEKLTWEKRDGTKVSLSEHQLKRMEQEYVTKLAGKLTVVPESDSRPAVITNAAPMFSAVDAAPMFSAVDAAAGAAESLPSWLL